MSGCAHCGGQTPRRLCKACDIELRAAEMADEWEEDDEQ